MHTVTRTVLSVGGRRGAGEDTKGGTGDLTRTKESSSTSTEITRELLGVSSLPRFGEDSPRPDPRVQDDTSSRIVVVLEFLSRDGPKRHRSLVFMRPTRAGGERQRPSVDRGERCGFSPTRDL